MKNTLLFLFAALLLPVFLIGQITLTDSHFPQAGDKLYLAVDTFPNILLTPPSPTGEIWNFEFLEVDRYEVQNIKAASQGAVADSFPDADIIIPFFEGDGYAKVHSDSIEVLGFYGAPTPGLADFDVFVKMNPFITSHRKGYTYGSTGYDTGFFHVEIDAADIPPDADLPIDPSTLDSLRMDFSMIRVDTVDAWGTLTTPFGTYDVIRVKETEYRNSIVDVKHPFFGWVNLNNFGVDGIGLDTLVYFSFLNDQSKEPICRVLTGTNDLGFFFSMGWWKVDALTVATEEVNQQDFTISHFPNPATENLTIKMQGLRSGDYKIKIYNILGRQMREIPVQLFGDVAVPVNLNTFSQGTYFYTIYDDNGLKLSTNRFFVLRP